MELIVQKRDPSLKLHTLRKEGILPGIVYGRKEPATSITVPYKEFEKVLRIAGESSVITLKGLDGDKEVLIQAVAVDPVSSRPIHADFYAIEKGQSVTVSIPLVFEGVASAVKDFGGVLTKVIHEVEIEVLPKELPHTIVVDVSTLKNLGDQIHIKDLAFPPSAKVFIDENEVVAMVSAAVEEPVDAPAMDISQIEVQERGKKEEEATDSEA